MGGDIVGDRVLLGGDILGDIAGDRVIRWGYSGVKMLTRNQEDLKVFCFLIQRLLVGCLMYKRAGTKSMEQ